MHRERQSVVKTSVKLQAALLHSHHVLTSSVHCQSTVPQQNGIDLLNIGHLQGLDPHSRGMAQW